MQSAQTTQNAVRWGSIILAAVLAVCACTAWGGGAYYLSGHASTSTGVNRVPSLYGRGECSHCHEAHASQDGDTTLYRYALFALEENACWACHDGTVTYAANTRSPVSTTSANTATNYYKHPISNLYSGTTPSAHRWGESASAAFSGANRHAECTDCHDPHTAQNTGSPGVSIHTPGGANGNRLSPALLNATGIVVTAWQAAGTSFTGATKSFATLSSTTTNYEWQLCFKCHSAFTTLPTYTVGSGYFLATKITSVTAGQVQEYRDVGQAYNPNNLSYHPVTAVGQNANIPAASFLSPWSASSTMYCSDCHGKTSTVTGGSGPHGSSAMHLLQGTQDLQVHTGSFTRDLCLKCHRYETYVSGTDPYTNTNYRDGTNNLHNQHENNAPCYTCHDPHGANNPHLLNFDMAEVSRLSGSTRTSYTFWETYPAGSPPSTATGGVCNLSCHKQHSGKTYIR